MPLIESRPITEDESLAGLVLLDPLLFRLYFFSDEFTLEPSKEQKLFLTDQSDRVLLCTGRKLGKSLHLEALILQDGITHYGDGVEEALFFTPSDVHMTPFIDRVFGRINRTPLFKALVREMRRGDSTMLEFRGGLRWYGRLEGLSGTDRNVVGLRASRIIGDEQAFGTWAVYNSLLQTALPGARWVLAGVPHGVRNTPFYNIDQSTEGKSWSKWKFPTFINPIYEDQKYRDQLETDYGGKDTQGYITQVLGLWGEELISSFPPGSIATKAGPYFIRDVKPMTEAELAQIAIRVGIPSVRCDSFAIGWDYGFSPDPSVVIGAFTRGEDVWSCYFRLNMRRVALPHQAAVVMHVVRQVFNGQFVGLSCDNHGAIQTLQSLDPERSHLYLWANPGGSTPTQISAETREFDEISRMVRITPAQKDVNVPNKELYTTFLKNWMVNAVVDIEGRKLWLGDDKDLVDELVATTERKSSGRTMYYGPTDPNNRTATLDHNRDAATYLCHAINYGVGLEGQLYSETELISAMGWSGGETTWKAPWEQTLDNRK